MKSLSPRSFEAEYRSQPLKAKPVQAAPAASGVAEAVPCYHCGADCGPQLIEKDEKAFCCHGCATVYALLNDNALCQYYDLNSHPGLKLDAEARSKYAFLDQPEVEAALLDFKEGNHARVHFFVPAIHCSSCLYLLEHLYKLADGVLRSEVNFPKKEVSIHFDPAVVSLRGVVELMAAIGYPPSLNLDRAAPGARKKQSKKVWYQLGVAGFCAGNIMLLSFPEYFGLEAVSFAQLFGFLNIGLALPVLFYSARDYFISAWKGLRKRSLNMDVPISLGISVLFLRSVYEIVSGMGAGYLDSMAGLVLFLLLGKVYQQKSYHLLSFERDYKSYFPLAVIRLVGAGGSDRSSPEGVGGARSAIESAGEGDKERNPGGHTSLGVNGERTGIFEESVPLEQVQQGDRLLIRNGELVPADGRLVAGEGRIDYSFVTGESELVRKETGEKVFAGGRQFGSAIEVVVEKAVAQSYLTQLWEHDAFRKEDGSLVSRVSERAARVFTPAVLLIALGAAVFWGLYDASRVWFVISSVLIVACPCALALASPFTLGNAIRAFGRRRFFLKGPVVVEQLAEVDHVVFDKTGTLTDRSQASVDYSGDALGEWEVLVLRSLLRHSMHPLSQAVLRSLPDAGYLDVEGFQELKGAGLSGLVDGVFVRIGSARLVQGGEARSGARLNADAERGFEGQGNLVGARAFVGRGITGKQFEVDSSGDTGLKCTFVEGVKVGGEFEGEFELGGHPQVADGSRVFVAIGDDFRGCFVVGNHYREGLSEMLGALEGRYPLSVLTGDSARERARLAALFPAGTEFRFRQSPADKLAYIQGLQAEGKKVLMVGDGLNDAGALKQSNVGISVAEDAAAFTPASDAILEGGAMARLGRFLMFSHWGMRVIYFSFFLSLLYNVVGLGFALTGDLSPLVAAILMPMSSVSVIAFTTLMIRSKKL